MEVLTKSGEIVSRQRMFLIWDVPSDEIILGGELLTELGIEPKTALDALIVSKRQKTGNKLQGGHTCQSDMIDDQDDDEEVRIAKTSSDDIEEGLKFLIKSAQDNGLPNEWVTKWSKLVQKYRDVWRT